MFTYPRYYSSKHHVTKPIKTKISIFPGSVRLNYTLNDIDRSHRGTWQYWTYKGMAKLYQIRPTVAPGLLVEERKKKHVPALV